jgi:hypothetical protein
MNGENDQNSIEDPAAPIQRVEIQAPASLDWASALKELETAQPAAAERVTEPAPEQAAARPAYVPRPPRKPPVIEEGTAAPEYLSEVLTSVNSALNQLKRFETSHKAVIAPNIYRVWEDSLRETATVMTREFRRLREAQETSSHPTATTEPMEEQR